MVSGKPGDHWLTDLTDWHIPAFGDPVDGLIVAILDLGGEGALNQSPWKERLWDLWPRWGRSDLKDRQIDAFVQPLTQLRDRLRQSPFTRAGA
jgi:hypothetical protein